MEDKGQKIVDEQILLDLGIRITIYTRSLVWVLIRKEIQLREQ